MILSKPNHIKIYGHRGARGDLPENTLESFKYLFENNINAYETDILISKDLIPVITHDFRLDPSLTKNNEGNWIEDENIKIFDLTYEELLKFDVGSLNKLSRYGRRFVNQKKLENQRIPKLSELLDLSSKISFSSVFSKLSCFCIELGIFLITIFSIKRCSGIPLYSKSKYIISSLG